MVRLIVYALVVSVAAAFAQYEWTLLGLDGWDTAQAWRDRAGQGIGILTVALAILGHRFAAVATFLLGMLVGAVATAPFALAHALAR